MRKAPLPLNAFFDQLRREGIRVGVREHARLRAVFSAQHDWTISAVRDCMRAMLAHEPEQRAAFDRCFRKFFPHSSSVDWKSPFDLAAAIDELRPASPTAGPRPEPTAILPDGSQDLPDGDRMPAAPSKDWWSVLTDALQSFFENLSHVFDRWFTRRTPPKRSEPDQTPPPPTGWQPNRTVHDYFSLASIGGQIPPFMPPSQVKRLADMLGYFRTELAGRRIDLPSSIDGTVAAGGLPQFCYQPRSMTRRMLLLEDAATHPDFHTKIVDDLCRGLAETGVVVQRGRFAHGLAKFRDPRGAVVELSELERESESHVVLIFSDGASFDGTSPVCEQARKDLARLARWPRVAWIDFREPRFRSSSGNLAAELRLPVFPATPLGLQRAMESFLFRNARILGEPPTEQITIAPDCDPDTYVETLLGDALLWAAECSLLKPCSLALADALRRRFWPTLPPSRLQRILRLDGVGRDVVGLTFQPRIRAALKRIWLARRSDDQQRRVLRFILEQINAARPDQAADNSLAHTTWQASQQVVRIELDANDELVDDLERLVATPAAAFVHEALDRCQLSTNRPAAIDRIPLRETRDPAVAKRLLAVLPELQPDDDDRDRVSKLRFEMVEIEPGEFLMGSPPDQPGRHDDETLHRVRITRPFYLSKHPVTQAQFEQVMGHNPSRFRDAGPDAPVEQVTWDDAVEFCRRLNQSPDLAQPPTGYVFALPTEAQWEFACRAGTTTPFSTGEQLSAEQENIGSVVESTTPVGKYPANPWGLHDMHGNVAQWCFDGCERYSIGEVVDPCGRHRTRTRVVRGGSWFSDPSLCRSAARRWREVAPDADDGIGFRIAAVQPSELAERTDSHCPPALELRWIEPGEFVMGSPETEAGRRDNERQHHVTLTRGFYLGRFPVTQSQYESVMNENPSTFKNAGPHAPVEQVSWDEAVEFCEKLTALHHAAEMLPPEYVYTLPTEAQWEFACRGGHPEATYAGELEILGDNHAPVLDAIAWYGGNSGVDYDGGWDSSDWPGKQYDHQRAGTHPVGEKAGNENGLFDTLGNVFEWCADWFGEYSKEPVRDPWGAPDGAFRVLRGGCWDSSSRLCRAAFRDWYQPALRDFFLGFRVAAVQQAELQAREAEGRGRALELIWIEPGEFLMGSPGDEAERSSGELQHPVTISRGFYLGKYAVTQELYQKVMGKNPSRFTDQGEQAPVECVSWDDAMAFCERLTQQERENGTLPKGYVYTLPSEAQWEYACRAGTTTPFHFGESLCSDQANFDGNYPYGGAEKGPNLERKCPVGSYEANAWGLYDMHGNVWEWCYDWYGDYASEDVTDPLGPVDGASRVLRGGGWDSRALQCRAAFRGWTQPASRYYDLGFRVAAVQEAEQEEREAEGRGRTKRE